MQVWLAAILRRACYNFLIVWRTLVLFCVALAPGLAAELKPEAVAAYDRYIHDTEARLAAAKPFLWVDASPERLKLVKEGQVAVDPWKGDGDTFVAGASIHDWVGAIFIPGATLEKTLAVLQDYDHHKSIYKDVPDSKLISRNGNDFKYYRLRSLHNSPISGSIPHGFRRALSAGGCDALGVPDPDDAGGGD